MWSAYTVRREGGIALRSDFDPDNPLHIFWPPDVTPPEVYTSTTGKLLKFKKIQIIVCTTVADIAKALIKPRIWYQQGEPGADKPEDEYDLYLYHDTGNRADTKILSWGSMVHMLGRVRYLEPENPNATRLRETFAFYDDTSLVPITLVVFFDPTVKSTDKDKTTNCNRDLLLRAAFENLFIDIYAFPAIIVDKKEGKRYTRLNLMRATETSPEQAEAFPSFCEMLNRGFIYDDTKPNQLQA